MIARIWHGWTLREKAEAYESLLRTKIFPGLQRIPGHEGAFLLRRDSGGEVEFITMTLFASMDAVRAFAGEDFEIAVISPEASKLLARFDQKSVHYEVALGPN